MEQIKREAAEGIRAAGGVKELEELRVALLGKKGRLTGILKGMGRLSAEERPALGQLANEARDFIEGGISAAKAELSRKATLARLAAETIDVTLPGKARARGHYHPMTTAMEELKRIFLGMRYEIAEGPDIETEYYNFDALNIPSDHPARDEQDTFYVEGKDADGGGFALRTATSPVQARTMERGRLPIRMICPGQVFRADEVDATHSPVFHQMEGLVVDKGVTFGDLKGALMVFAREFLGEDTRARFRPHYFPFTEPSAEMDVSCFKCGGAGCNVCKGEGWIEVLGCGMVHPRVLEMRGIDPAVYSGFAFGMGLERIAMLRGAISDMRLLFENDVNFLNQF